MQTWFGSQKTFLVLTLVYQIYEVEVGSLLKMMCHELKHQIQQMQNGKQMIQTHYELTWEVVMEQENYHGK